MQAIWKWTWLRLLLPPFFKERTSQQKKVTALSPSINNIQSEDISILFLELAKLHDVVCGSFQFLSKKPVYLFGSSQALHAFPWPHPRGDNDRVKFGAALVPFPRARNLFGLKHTACLKVGHNDITFQGIY